MPRKSFGIVRVRPYSLEGGCIVYVELPENAKGDWLDEDVRLWERFWEDIIGYCEKIRGSIYPVMVLSTDGRRLLRIRRLKGTLFLPEGVEEVADYAATDEDDNEISRIVWNGSIRRIGKEAFWKAVTNAVVLPPTVESVGDRPFSGDYIVSCQCHFGDTVDKNQSAPSSVRRYKNYRRFLDDMAWIGHICRASSCIAAVYAHYPKTDQKIPLNDLVLTALLYWPFADIMSLIDAVEREMPGRISKVKDALGNNALWYLMMKQHGPYFLPDGRYRFGVGGEDAAKRLVELGMDPFETTPTGLSWYEIAIGEDDTKNMVVINPRIVFLSMLKKRMMDMGESQGVSKYGTIFALQRMEGDTA